MDVGQAINKAVRRKVLLLATLTIAEALSLFLSLVAFFILWDGSLGLSLGARLCLRYFICGVSLLYLFLAWAARSKGLQRPQIVQELGAYWRARFPHDALLNAWEFESLTLSLSHGERGGGEGEQKNLGFSALFKGREIKKATDVLQILQSRLFEPYSFKFLFKKLPRAHLMALVLSPSLISLVPSPSYRIARLFEPTSDFARLAKNIELDPKPGSYRVNSGDPLSIKARLLSQALSMNGDDPMMEVTPPPSRHKWREGGGVNGRKFPLVALSGRESFLFSLPHVVEKLKLRLIWGDFVSDPWEIIPVAPPEIKELKVAVWPPAYAKRAKETWTNPNGLKVLAGSHLETAVVADRELKQIIVNFKEGGKPPYRIGLSFTARTSGEVRFLLEDQEGRINSQAWVLPLEALTDEPPSIVIRDPAFSVINMDLNEELSIFWEASDDIALSETSVEVLGVTSAHLSGSRVLWRSGAPSENTQSLKDIFVFRPKEWKLAPGDEVRLVLEAKDNYPERTGGSLSAEGLFISINDFRRGHEDNMRQEAKKIEEEMLRHLEAGLGIEESFKVMASTEDLKTALRKYNEQSRQLGGQLEAYRKNLEKDPLVHPKVAWGLARLQESLAASRSSHLEASQENLRANDRESAQRSFGRYMEEFQKAAAAFDELKKEQKVFDTLDNTGRLEALVQNLQNDLESSKDLAQMKEILADIDRELRDLAETLSRMSPEDLPQEFINQIREKDLPVEQMMSMKQALEEAMAKGDKAKALEAAKKMLEALRRARKSLESANKSYQESSQKFPALNEKLEEAIANQKTILEKTNSVEMALGLRKSKSEGDQAELSEQETAVLSELSKNQKDLTPKSREILKILADLDTTYPTLLFGSKVVLMEPVPLWQEQATDALRGFDLKNSLEKESSALKNLEKLKEDLDKLVQDLQNMPMEGSSAGGYKPLIFLPGMPQASPYPGWGGSRLGRVAIPRPEDYKALPQTREEILKSLQESMPQEVKPKAQGYLEKLLK